MATNSLKPRISPQLIIHKAWHCLQALSRMIFRRLQEARIFHWVRKRPRGSENPMLTIASIGPLPRSFTGRQAQRRQMHIQTWHGLDQKVCKRGGYCAWAVLSSESHNSKDGYSHRPAEMHVLVLNCDFYPPRFPAIVYQGPNILADREADVPLTHIAGILEYSWLLPFSSGSIAYPWGSEMSGPRPMGYSHNEILIPVRHLSKGFRLSNPVVDVDIHDPMIQRTRTAPLCDGMVRQAYAASG
ncbi:hypothetical protein B0H11DRAFT_1907690 [Mycena galericulata]|nr:hypothetical protein B0H11DRAFT_1907690 [Mycena galericulata]